MQAHKTKNRGFRNFVKSIPVVGPAATSIYRRNKAPKQQVSAGKTAKKPVSEAKQVYSRIPQDILCLNRTQAFDEYASFSSDVIAEILENAINSVAASIPVVIFPSDKGNSLQLGLRGEDSLLFTQHLSAKLGTHIAWKAKSPLDQFDYNFVEIAKRVRRLEASLRFGMNISVDICVSLYFPVGERMDSPDTSNQFIRYIRNELQERMFEPDLMPSSELLGGEAIDHGSQPVDVVYTWVDSTNKNWQEMYRAAIGPNDAEQAEAANSPDDEPESDAASLARFLNRQELRYSLRSVEQYMPWVRKIFVFTNCEMPDWLTTSDRLVWVMHDEVMDAKHLPTFNSHAIESYLHKIPGLSDNFVYFNDDFFINQAIPRSFFFAPNGVSNANLEDYGAVNGVVNDDDPDYLNAARNGAALLRDLHGKVPTRLHKHTPYALNKPLLGKLEAKFKKEFEQTRKSSFRSITDLSIASFLYHHYSYCQGSGTQVGYRIKLVKNSSSNLERDLNALKENSSIRTFCLNDGQDSHDDADWNRRIPAFLQARFPLPITEELGGKID